MSQQRWWLFVLFLIAGSPCAAEDWCCKFLKERDQAFKKSGPRKMEAAAHVHKKSEKMVFYEPVPAPPKPVRKRARKARKMSERRRSSPEHVKVLLSKARHARENGQLEQAALLYKNVQTIEPESVEAGHQLAEIEKEVN